MRSNRLTIVKVLSARPHTGGSGLSGTDLALELARRGHDVHIVSYPDTYLTDDQKQLLTLHPAVDFQYFSLRFAPVSLTLPAAIRQIAQQRRIDVLHAHYSITHGEAVITARDLLARKASRGALPYPGPRPIAVITSRGTDVSIGAHEASLAPALELFLSRADRLTFVSRSLQIEAETALDLDDYGVVIPNFVNEHAFESPPREHAVRRLRAKWQIADENFVFYHLSNFRPVKNVMAVIDAYARLAGSPAASSTRLLMIGHGPDWERARERAGQLHLQDRVTFTGHIEPEEVPNYTLLGDVLVLPSTRDACPRVAIEAMHAGNVVLASNVSGLPEIVEHESTGYLCDPHDVDALAGNMERLASDRMLRAQLGAAAKEAVVRKFDRRTVVERYETLYYQALDDLQRTDPQSAR